jgi:hypothetical protein
VLTFKLTLHRAFIIFVKHFLCQPRNLRQTLAFEFALPKKKKLRVIVIRNFPRRTPNHKLHVAFKIPYVYYFNTYLAKQPAEVIQNHDNKIFQKVGGSEAIQSIYKRLKFCGDRAYDLSYI